MSPTSPGIGMYSIKLVGHVQPHFPALTQAGQPALMNFPDSPDGHYFAANIPIGHKSLVYLMAPMMRIWAAVEYVKCGDTSLSLLEQGRQAAEAQPNIIAQMRALAPQYASLWRCIRFLASISTVAQTLLHPQAGFANPPGKLGIWGRTVSRVHD